MKSRGEHLLWNAWYFMVGVFFSNEGCALEYGKYVAESKKKKDRNDCGGYRVTKTNTCKELIQCSDFIKFGNTCVMLS